MRLAHCPEARRKNTRAVHTHTKVLQQNARDKVTKNLNTVTAAHTATPVQFFSPRMRARCSPQRLQGEPLRANHTDPFSSSTCATTRFQTLLALSTFQENALSFFSPTCLTLQELDLGQV